MSKSQTAGALASSEEKIPVMVQQPPESPPESPPASSVIPPEAGGVNAGNDKPFPPKKLNLVRFLQERPQSSGIKVLLNAKYRTAVKTVSEWEKALAELLEKKTK